MTLKTGSETVSEGNGFAVEAGQPSISVKPTGGEQGQTITNISIVGQFTHFVQGTTKGDFGAGIKVDLTVIDAAHAMADITISSAAEGDFVSLTTGAEIARSPDKFRVEPAPTPVIALDPTSGQSNQILNVGVVGKSTHFVDGTTKADFGTKPSFSKPNFTPISCSRFHLESFTPSALQFHCPLIQSTTSIARPYWR